MGNCKTCKTCTYGEEERNLHRDIDAMDWENIKRKFHNAIDGGDLIPLAKVKSLLKELQDIEAQYSLITEDKAELVSIEEIDILYEEYKELKGSDNDIDLRRKDEIRAIFDKNNVELVQQGYKEWIVQYDSN
jgi:hypothetical protein